MAVKVFKTPYTYGQPIEYLPQSTFDLERGMLVKINSTNVAPGGVVSPLGLSSGPAVFKEAIYISQKTQAGSTTRELNFPVLSVDPGVTYIVDHASSETVISTTDIGITYAVSSSGALVKSSTGNFKILSMTNTSDTVYQKLIGKFVCGSSLE